MLAKSLQAAAGNAGGDRLYIEDVFSTYLYTGNGSTQTITNGIDLAGEGGLVWLKNRSASASHNLYDTNRGTDLALQTNSTAAQVSTATYGVDQFLNTGFVVGGSSNNKWSNYSGDNYASWTFRKAEKFFDVVTYTGNGTSQTINHNLGSVPGCIIVKNLDGQNNWRVYHRSLGATKNLQLNVTDAENTNSGVWNDTAPTSTQFTVGSNGNVNRSGEQHVAYLFAHNAGGFGDDGEQNVISCGTYTETGSALSVDLGFEPQWLMVKRSNGTGNWVIIDNMRALNMSTTNGAVLFPNLSNAETNDPYWHPTATGFIADPYWGSGAQVIYIAIRRGPMKTPEAGTEVFAEDYLGQSSGGIAPAHRSGWPVDAFLRLYTPGGSNDYPGMFTRLLGKTFLVTSKTLAEQTFNNDMWPYNNGVWNATSPNSSIYTAMLRRAPGFFDVVCYTGTGSARTVNHNLGVAPELIIVKGRTGTNGAGDWICYHAALGNSAYINLNFNNAANTDRPEWNNTTPTSTVFSLDSSNGVNNSATTYVAYLFATVEGVSKVGSYTGTGTTQQINCGFSSGARFVLIKRTDSTGDWYVWDTARGIVAGNDPYLLLNSTAAEVTSTDYIDTYSAGFEISSTAPAAINANGGSFIFLAIA